MAESSAFISYHHDDRIIGEALADQFQFLAACGEGRRSISCFLDARDIPKGNPWKPIIDTNLANKDWLIVVFTGEQSVYSGYEIGTFSQLQERSTEKRIMGLYDVADEKLPVVLRDYQNTAVVDVENAVLQDEVALSADEVSFWFHSEIARFLISFCSYKSLYVTAHDAENPAAYSSNIALAAKRIGNAFALARGADVKSETPTQIGFELTIKRAGDTKLDKIPGDSVILGTSLFFDILGLALPIAWNQAPNTTWDKLGHLLNEGGRKKVPWMHKVEGDVIRAIESRTASGDDVTFRGASGRIYRPILARHKLYVNGDRTFYLLLVETLDRRFVGSRNSSLLLTDLILASRWRFTYFETWHNTVQRTFGEDAPLATFADNCKQLLYNIEWIEHEAADFGADDPKALIDAFGPEHRARVERFFIDWDAAKRGLFEVLEQGLDTEISDNNRTLIRAGILKFLERTRVQNTDFLELAVRAYSELVTNDLAKEGLRSRAHVGEVSD